MLAMSRTKENFRPYTKTYVEKILRLGKELQTGQRTYPPKIIALIHEIEDKTRNAELFAARLRQIDHGMIREVALLMHKRDQMVEEWLDSEQ